MHKAAKVLLLAAPTVDRCFDGSNTGVRHGGGHRRDGHGGQGALGRHYAQILRFPTCVGRTRHTLLDSLALLLLIIIEI